MTSAVARSITQVCDTTNSRDNTHLYLSKRLIISTEAFLGWMGWDKLWRHQYPVGTTHRLSHPSQEASTAALKEETAFIQHCNALQKRIMTAVMWIKASDNFYRSFFSTAQRPSWKSTRKTWNSVQDEISKHSIFGEGQLDLTSRLSASKGNVMWIKASDNSTAAFLHISAPKL